MKLKKTLPAIKTPTPVQAAMPTKEEAIRSVFDALPDSAWLREAQLVRKTKDPASTAHFLSLLRHFGEWSKREDSPHPANCRLE